jgi:hypothetical protein
VKKTWVIVGVVVVLLLVGGTLLIDRNRPKSPGNSSPGGGSQSATSTQNSSNATSTVNAKPKTPPKPQSAHVTLKKVTTPPAATIAFVDGKKFTANSTYKVAFVPYGPGPTSRSLVIAISTSKATGTIAHPFNFAGKNVLTDTRRLPVKKAVTKGGKYTGTIVLVSQGDVLVPMLISVSPSK